MSKDNLISAIHWKRLQDEIQILQKKLGEPVTKLRPIHCPEKLVFVRQIDDALQQLYRQRQRPSKEALRAREAERRRSAAAAAQSERVVRLIDQRPPAPKPEGPRRISRDQIGRRQVRGVVAGSNSDEPTAA